MNVFHILSQQSHWQINKELAKKIGLEAALLLSDLISKRQYFLNNDMTEQGWFYNTEQEIEADTTLSPYQQRKALEVCENAGFIKLKGLGMPRRRHYLINDEVIIKSLIFNDKSLKNFTTSHKKTSRQDVKDFNVNNNNKGIKTNKEVQVREQEFTEQVLTIASEIDFDSNEALKFINYWTEPGGKKLRFEKQQVFDIKRRLQRWLLNVNERKTSKHAKKELPTKLTAW